MRAVDKNIFPSEGTEVELETDRLQGANITSDWHSLLLYVNKREEKKTFSCKFMVSIIHTSAQKESES